MVLKELKKAKQKNPALIIFLQYLVWPLGKQYRTNILSERSPVLIILTTGAAGQRLAARLAAGRDGIRATFALAVAQLQQFGQRRLAAGTHLHQAGRARAGLTLSAVAQLLAAVSSAVQHPERGRGESVSGKMRMRNLFASVQRLDCRLSPSRTRKKSVPRLPQELPKQQPITVVLKSERSQDRRKNND